MMNRMTDTESVSNKCNFLSLTKKSEEVIERERHVTQQRIYIKKHVHTNIVRTESMNEYYEEKKAKK